MCTGQNTSDWLYNFLYDVQLVEFYDSFKNILQVTQLRHFDFVRTADLHRIGLSDPAVARVKNALKQQRRAAGLPKPSRHRWLHGFNFGIPFLDVLKYGSPRGCPILSASTIGEPNAHSKTALPRPRPASTTICGLDSSTTNKQPSFSPTPCCLIAPGDVELQEGRIGSGSFGVVRRGDWHAPSGQTVPVAVKILRSQNTRRGQLTPDLLTKVLSEVILMQSISHTNLIRIYGVILSNPLAIVTELAPLGSLLTYLRTSNSRQSPSSLSTASPPTKITAFPVDALWDVGIQLARGMAHLAANRLVHRDLAARNVLLFPSSSPSSRSDVAFPLVKIGDFGLLRSTKFKGDQASNSWSSHGQIEQQPPIYSGDQGQKIPFAWSSLEAISRHEFSQASDVWSWGVTVWEVWTGGAEPWQAITNSDSILTRLQAGCRLSWPRRTCPRRLYQLMLACWRSQPGQRPTFAYLAERLDKTRPSEVVAVQNFDEADRMDLMAGDHVIVIDGRPENFWWRGQNRRTGEIASFPREIVRLQRGVESQDISGPMIDSFVHTGHFGADGGQAWGHLDHMDPNFLSGIVPHHADTMGSGRCTTSGAVGSEASWHPLSAAASARGGGLSFIGGYGGYSGDFGEAELAGEDGSTSGGPVVGAYDKEGDDERRILDQAASLGSIIATQQLPPPSQARFPNNALNASDWGEVYSASVGPPTSSAGHQLTERPSSYSVDMTSSSMRQPSGVDETFTQPLIDFYRTCLFPSHYSSTQTTSPTDTDDTNLPIPSAPIYQSRTDDLGAHSAVFAQTGSPCPNPYFQAAWNSWMSSAIPTDVFGVRFRQQPNPFNCETQLLVGASPNPFLSTPTSPVKVNNAQPVATESYNFFSSAKPEKNTNPFLVSFSETGPLPSFLPRVFPQTPSMVFDPTEIDLIVELMGLGGGHCSREEAREALNCVLNSPQARAIIHLHTPPPNIDVFSISPQMRDWRVKTASRLLLLRRLARLDLCYDFETCWLALEKADWSVERAVDFLIYQ